MPRRRVHASGAVTHESCVSWRRPTGEVVRLHLSSDDPDAPALLDRLVASERAIARLAADVATGGSRREQVREALRVVLGPLAAACGLTGGAPSAPVPAVAEVEPASRSAPGITWADWVETLIGRYGRATNLREATVQSYTAAFRRASACPRLRALPLGRIDGDKLSDLNTWLRERASANTAGQTLRVVCSALAEAAESGLLDSDPVPALRRRAKRERWFDRTAAWVAPAFTLPDLARFLAAANAEPDPVWRAWADLSWCLGTRHGETSALLSADLDGRWITVRWQWPRNGVSGTPSGREGTDWLRVGGTVLTPPKTGGSRRRLALPRPALEAVLRLRRSGPLLLTTRDGNGLDPRSAETAFARMCRRAGLTYGRGRGYTTHSLRATTATLLGRQGVPERVVAAVLGHVPEGQTQHYQRPTDEDFLEAADALYRVVLPALAEGSPRGLVS